MLKTGRTARGRRRRERCGDHDIVWGRMVGGGSVASECVGNSLNRARGVIGRFRPKVARCAPSDTAHRLRARNPRAERAERKALSARARPFYTGSDRTPGAAGVRERSRWRKTI